MKKWFFASITSGHRGEERKNPLVKVAKILIYCETVSEIKKRQPWLNQCLSDSSSLWRSWPCSGRASRPSRTWTSMFWKTTGWSTAVPRSRRSFSQLPSKSNSFIFKSRRLCLDKIIRRWTTIGGGCWNPGRKSGMVCGICIFECVVTIGGEQGKSPSLEWPTIRNGSTMVEQMPYEQNFKR